MAVTDRRRALLLCLLVGAGLMPVPAAAGENAWDFTFDAIEGRPMPLSEFRSKVLLVVNTASFCGYTKQYQGLQALHDRYGDKGLVVIGVPSNDFGGQEPGSEAEIAKFCEGAFGITFPLTTKQTVKGPKAHPFYAWAARALGPAAAPRWNFHKYLVAADGHLVTHFATAAEPDSPGVIAAIERELGRRNAPGSKAP